MKKTIHFSLDVTVDVPEDSKLDSYDIDALAQKFLDDVLESGCGMNDNEPKYPSYIDNIGVTNCSGRWHWCKDTRPERDLFYLAVSQVMDFYGDYLDTMPTVARYYAETGRWEECSTGKRIWPVRWTEMLGGARHQFDKEKD